MITGLPKDHVVMPRLAKIPRCDVVKVKNEIFEWVGTFRSHYEDEEGDLIVIDSIRVEQVKKKMIITLSIDGHPIFQIEKEIKR